MVFKNAENAKIKAQGTRRDEKTIQLGANSDRSTGTGRTSIEIGGQSFSTNRDDREGGNFINECGQATVGKIVDDLILKITNEVTELEELIADRRDYLRDLKEISEQIHENKK